METVGLAKQKWLMASVCTREAHVTCKAIQSPVGPGKTRHASDLEWRADNHPSFAHSSIMEVSTTNPFPIKVICSLRAGLWCSPHTHGGHTILAPGITSMHWQGDIIQERYFYSVNMGNKSVGNYFSYLYHISMFVKYPNFSLINSLS